MCMGSASGTYYLSIWGNKATTEGTKFCTKVTKKNKKYPL